MSPKPIVRFDTAEHPTELAPVLAAIANTGALAYVDLEFPAALGLMPQHELDVDQRYRAMVRHITDNVLEAGGAHGFVALPPEHASKIIVCALSIVRGAELGASELIQWGFDLACILSAFTMGIPIVRVPQNGTVARDRTQSKCDKQYQHACQIASAAHFRMSSRINDPATV